jgi:AraC-like DNA-binding protein
VGFRTVEVMAEEAAPHGGEWAEREHTPSVVLPADARLRSWVAGDYGGFDEDALPHGDLVVPATFVTPLVVEMRDSPLRPPAFVIAPNGTYTRVEVGRCAPDEVIRVHMAPLGAYKLLGPALSEIGGSLVRLEDIVGDDARRLREQIQSAPTWEQRGRLLDDFLLDRATHGPQPSPEVSHAWHLLARSGGRDPIRGIAREVGWSHKHLIAKFKQQVGVAPRTAARLLRLSTVWRHIDDDQTWARIAAESGYADQAHLIREFRHFTGTTPAALTTFGCVRK